MTHVTIIRNAVVAKLVDADRATKQVVQKALSYEVNGGYGSQWTGVTSMFDWDSCKFPAGFTQSVVQILKRQKHTVQVHQRTFAEPLGCKHPIVSDFPSNPAYAFQDETVERMTEKGGMIAQISTGGGKSICACKARARIGRMTLFLTTQGTLMHQMRDNFNIAFEVEKRNGTLRPDATCGIIGDGKFQPSKTCNVATVQSIAAALNDPKSEWDAKKIRNHLKKKRIVTQILEQTVLLILEEAHEASGNQFYEITKLCRNADYRLALTATPFMKSDVEANMRLLGAVGGIGIRVTERYLIDHGILAKPYFKFIPVGYAPDEENIDKYLNGKYPTPKVSTQTDYQRAYTLGITFNKLRNTMIVREVADFARHGLTSLVLVKRTLHGELLRDQLQAKGLKATFISGKDNQAKRKAAIDDLKSGRSNVLVATTILDVGVDVPSVGAIIIAGGDKAEVQMRQRIGRGLRAKKVGANQCFVVDFIDGFNKHLQKHSFERKAIINETDGFKQNILMGNEDFPFN